ncbi:rRNA pseudouridine synthase [Candidatus Parcubacteria bacterium]|nr:rRNA pseudouridine synthase [Candidatus Parcubacteria bacterium]
MDKKIILQKFIVDSGYCSRRQATELIRSGQVKINNKMAELGQKVLLSDKVLVNDKILKIKAEKIYLIINKPKGYVCSNRKFKGEDNIFDLLVNREGESVYPREKLFVVGRLDKNSRGLILITNDGDMAQRITHPKYEHEKEYEIRIKNYPPKAACPSFGGDQPRADESRIKNKELKIKEIVSRFLMGIDIGEGDGIVKAKATEYLGQGKFKIILTSGKKRQIRRMFKVLNLEIADLIRIRIGNIELGDLKTGQWRCLRIDEIKNLIQN